MSEHTLYEVRDGAAWITLNPTPSDATPSRRYC